MADTKLTALSAFAPVRTDLLYGVDDPGGTPASGKMTIADALGLTAAADISDLDAAIAANTAVAANTAKVTNATHTGDVTGSGALTIANDAVTNAKLANMATTTIKGRVTAGTGDPEDLTAAQAKTVLAYTAADIPIVDTGALITATNTETALAEIASNVDVNAGRLTTIENDYITSTSQSVYAYDAGGLIGAVRPIVTSEIVVWFNTGGTGAKPTNALDDDIWPSKDEGRQHLFIPAAAMISRTTSGAEAASTELATNDVMLETMNFDTAADEHVQFSLQMPKNWDEGTLIAQFIWSHPSTTTNFGVTWAIQAVAFADGDAGDTAFGTAILVDDTGGTTDDVYISPESAAITVAGTPGAEEWVVFQVYRDVSDANDTLAVDARLHGVKVHWTNNALTAD